VTAYTLFGQPASPAAITDDTSDYTMGVQFTVSGSGCTLTAIWFWSAPGAGALPDTIALYAVSGQSLVHSEAASWSGTAGSGWVRAAFSAPPSLTTSVAYKAGIFENTGNFFYSGTSHYWDTGPGSGGITSGPLSAPASSGADGGQDTFTAGSILAYPASSFNAANYWVDPEVTTAAGTPHTATASLALVLSFAAPRVRGRYRTASLAVTPSFSMAAARGRYRAAALSLVPSFAAIPAHGRYRHAALPLTASFTVHAVHGHYRPAALVLAPSFTVLRQHGHLPHAALSLSASFTAVRAAGRYRAAALVLSPSFGAAGRGGVTAAPGTVTAADRAVMTVLAADWQPASVLAADWQP
jgi:Domain of unknown function (DUF4082)